MAHQILTNTTRPGDGNLHYYYLPKGLVHLKVFRSGSTDAPSYRVELSEEVKVVPDPAHRYFFKYHANAFTSDNIEITFSPEGFLRSINTSVKDETGAIIQSVVDLGKELAAAVVGVKSRGIEEEVQIFEKYFDPFDAAVMAEIKGLLESINYSFEVKSIGAEPVEQGPSSSFSDRFGFFCRPTATYELILSKWALPAVEGGDRPIEFLQSILVSLPHPTVTHCVEIPMASWVQNEFTAEFSETGYPVSIKFSKPSSALAFAQIPLNILRSILELPAMIFKFRIDLMSQKQELWRNEQAYQEANDQRLEANKARLEVKKSAESQAALERQQAEADQKLKAMESENQLLRKRISSAGTQESPANHSQPVANPPGSIPAAPVAPPKKKSLQSDYDPI